MQRPFFLIFSLLSVLSLKMAIAGEGIHRIPSTLRAVTVYRSSAEMSHTASTRLEQGNNELVIEDVSNSIDPHSIRIGCSGNVVIMSVAFSTDYRQGETVSPFIKRIQDPLAVIKKEMTLLEVLSKSAADGLDLLHANKSIAGSATGVTTTELSKMMD